MEIYTIGFTQTTAERFFERLGGAGVGRLLDVRPYKAQDDDRERHWLQLNGICLLDRAVGEIP